MKSQIKISSPDNYGNMKVQLLLPDKSYKSLRFLGEIKNRCFHTSRKPENQKFNKLNGIGFNHELISVGGHLFDLIKIQYGFNELITTRKFVLDNGKILQFKKNDLDKQIILPLELFGLELAMEWERNKIKNNNSNNSNNQMNLF